MHLFCCEILGEITKSNDLWYRLAIFRRKMNRNNTNKNNFVNISSNDYKDYLHIKDLLFYLAMDHSVFLTDRDVVGEE